MTLIEEITRLTDELTRRRAALLPFDPVGQARVDGIAQALHGPGGLWERRRRELALRRAHGDARVLGNSEDRLWPE
jgi:hypothetical protein